MRAVLSICYVILYLPCLVLADEQSLINTFSKTRYKTIADQVNQVLGGQHFNLEADANSYLASVYVYKPSANNVPNGLCYLLYNKGQLDKLLDDTVAWIFGHELSHCVNGDSEISTSTSQQIEKELKADLMGKEAMGHAGFHFDRVIKDRIFIKMMEKSHSTQHLSWYARLENLGYGAQSASNNSANYLGNQVENNLSNYALINLISYSRH